MQLPLDAREAMQRQLEARMPMMLSLFDQAVDEVMNIRTSMQGRLMRSGFSASEAGEMIGAVTLTKGGRGGGLVMDQETLRNMPYEMPAELPTVAYLPCSPLAEGRL